MNNILFLTFDIALLGLLSATIFYFVKLFVCMYKNKSKITFHAVNQTYIFICVIGLFVGSLFVLLGKNEFSNKAFIFAMYPLACLFANAIVYGILSGVLKLEDEE